MDEFDLLFVHYKNSHYSVSNDLRVEYIIVVITYFKSLKQFNIISILGQVWYLGALIPDPCCFSYFETFDNVSVVVISKK